MCVAGLFSARDVLPDTVLPVKSCLPQGAGRLWPGMRWLDCPPRLEELRGLCLPWDWFFALDSQAKLGACPAACQGCILHGRLWVTASEEAYGWMLRQSAPAAGGLQRGDFPRLTFLHYLAHGNGISEPQGRLLLAWGACVSAWFLFRGLGFLLYLLCLGFSLSLCRGE